MFPFVQVPGRASNRENNMPLTGHKIETTSDNFGNLVRKNCLLVDKTLMIKEFLEGKDVSLVIRPRRFGKTINLSMLQYFLSAEVAGTQTAELFNNLVIAKEEGGKFLQKHQGQYPVIFITFKDSKEPSFDATINQLRDLVQELYREHEKCLSSVGLTASNKALFKKYLDGTVNDEQLQKSLKFLSEFLYKAYDKKVIILIDEYDTPLTNAYQNGSLELLSNFMRDMFSAALKSNPFLEKGLMTGILRVSKSSMLSGLNNLKVYTLLDKEYCQYFGFTEDEIKELVHYTKSDANLKEIRAYYNGYNIGGTVIYNPWSTMQFLDSKELMPYWVLTSNDGILRNIFLESNDTLKTLLGDLMQGKSITGKIDINLRYEDLMTDPDALWTLLLFCGYLTVENKKQEYDRWVCQLKIPNTEILAQYRRIFSDWLEKKLGQTRYTSLLSSLLAGNVDGFTDSLGDYLMESLSFHDVKGKKPEKFYHGFVAGLIASIRDTHWIDSNKESGRGRYDLLLIPKDVHQSLGIIIEFKKTDNVEAVNTMAETAMSQINTSAYDTELKRYSHIHRVLKIGLAFCDKAVVSAYQTEELTTHKNGALALSKIVNNVDITEW